MFQTVPVGDTIWRVVYTPTDTVAGYVKLILVGDETRYKAQLIRYGRLGASLGEYPSVAEASDAFRVLEASLTQGLMTFDTAERWNKRSPKSGLPPAAKSGLQPALKSGRSAVSQRKSWYTGDPAADTAVRYD